MPILERQRHETPIKSITATVPECLHNALVEYAYEKRITIAKAVSSLLDNAMNEIAQKEVKTN